MPFVQNMLQKCYLKLAKIWLDSFLPLLENDWLMTKQEYLYLTNTAPGALTVI